MSSPTLVSRIENILGVNMGDRVHILIPRTDESLIGIGRYMIIENIPVSTGILDLHLFEKRLSLTKLISDPRNTLEAR